jgi:hypothetical protein
MLFTGSQDLKCASIGSARRTEAIDPKVPCKCGIVASKAAQSFRVSGITEIFDKIFKNYLGRYNLNR